MRYKLLVLALMIGILGFVFSGCFMPFEWTSEEKTVEVVVGAISNTVYVEAGKSLDISDEKLAKLNVQEVTVYFTLSNACDVDVTASCALSSQGEAGKDDYKIYLYTPSYLTPENEHVVYEWLYKGESIPTNGTKNIEKVIPGDSKVLKDILNNKMLWIVIKNDPNTVSTSLSNKLYITSKVKIKAMVRVL